MEILWHSVIFYLFKGCRPLPRPPRCILDRFVWILEVENTETRELHMFFGQPVLEPSTSQVLLFKSELRYHYNILSC